MSDAREVPGRVGPHERDLRRADFVGGQPIRLADGQEWHFPGPEQIELAGRSLLSEVLGLLEAIASAEDEAEQRRGELALAIRLLAVNYDLSPELYMRLLTCRSGGPELAGMQGSFGALARRHGEVLWPRREPRTEAGGHPFGFTAFRSGGARGSAARGPSGC